MSTTLAPYGLRPSYHATGGEIRAQAYPAPFSAAYATDLYQGTPVALDTSGNVVLATLTNDLIGSFDGVEYTDSNGRRQYSKRWIASTTATDIIAYVYTDPQIVYEIQATGSLAQTSIGDQADFSGTAGYLIASGNNTTQLSTTGLSSTLEGAGVQGQCRIIGLVPLVDNEWGDTYTQVYVQIAQHQFVANKTGI